MAEKILIDFTEETKVSVIKEKARQALIEDIVAYLSDKYDDCRKTASNEIGVVVGEAKDEVNTYDKGTTVLVYKGNCYNIHKDYVSIDEKFRVYIGIDMNLSTDIM